MYIDKIEEVAPTFDAGQAREPVAQRSLRRRLLWGGALLVLLALAAWLWTQRHTAAPGAETATRSEPGMRARAGGPGAGPTPVSVATVASADLSVFVSALGTVTPTNTVTVHTRIDGQLMRVAFKEGQMVKEGDLLAEIDPRPYQVQLAQAQGQLAKDQALLDAARVDLARYQQLIAEDSIAKQQVDTQASLVRQYEGTVKSDQSQVDNARLQLTYTRITSPIAGRTGLRQVDPGNIVHAGDTNGLVVVSQLQPISVVYAVPQANLPDIMARIHAGEVLTVEAWDQAGKAKLADGQLLTVDNQIDPTTGTIKHKAQFANADGALFPNQFVNVRMKLETRHGVVVMPSAAVQRGSQGVFAYVIDAESKVHLRPLTLGAVEGERVQVLQGLQPGERVVADGADKLRADAKVEVIEPGKTPGAAAPAKGAQSGEHRRGKQSDATQRQRSADNAPSGS